MRHIAEEANPLRELFHASHHRLPATNIQGLAEELADSHLVERVFVAECRAFDRDGALVLGHVHERNVIRH